MHPYLSDSACCTSSLAVSVLRHSASYDINRKPVLLCDAATLHILCKDSANNHGDSCTSHKQTYGCKAFRLHSAQLCRRGKPEFGYTDHQRANQQPQSAEKATDCVNYSDIYQTIDERLYGLSIVHVNCSWKQHRTLRQATWSSPIPCSRSTLITLGLAPYRIWTNPYHDQGSCSLLSRPFLPGHFPLVARLTWPESHFCPARLVPSCRLGPSSLLHKI